MLLLFISMIIPSTMMMRAGVVLFARMPGGACLALLDYKNSSGDTEVFFLATRALPAVARQAKYDRADVEVADAQLQVLWGSLFMVTVNTINHNFMAS
jgi:hypothetical protein